MKTVIGIGVVALLGIGATVLAQQAAFKRTVLLEAELSIPQRDVITALAEIPPGGSPGRHTHPGEEIGYVLEGSVLLEEDEKGPRMLKAGDTFLIPPGTVHNATNKGAGTARILATYIVERGEPVATAVPAPAVQPPPQ